MIELNGGTISSQEYTVNLEKDMIRKAKHVRILMYLFKQLDFDDWHTITIENLTSWIEKLSKLSPDRMKVHNVFHPSEVDKELKEIAF